MQSLLPSHALLLAPDPRQTVLASVGPAGLNRQSYSAYGYQHGPAAYRTGFNGQLREPQGWYHLGNGHRVYNPMLMRFHSPDHLSPFGEGGLNGYAYCLGDPVNYTDPTGKLPEWIFHWAVPTAALVLSGGLLLANVLTVIVAPAVVTGLALGSARLSVMGSILGMMGATTQLASPPDSTARTVGSVVSLSGTLLSIGGAVTRFAIQLSKFLKEPGSVLGRVSYGLGVLFRGQPKAPVPPTVSRSASVAGSVRHANPKNSISNLSRRGSTSSASSSSSYGTASDRSRSVSRRVSLVRSGSDSSYQSTSSHVEEIPRNVLP